MERISATIPRQVLRAADQRARALGRSRSWVITEALRQYVKDAPALPAPGGTVGGGSGGLGEQRLTQLLADLRLTPEQRVREAERTLRLSTRGEPGRQPVIAFDSFEDYLEWDRREKLR